MMEFRCIQKSANLPDDWNSLADDYFQQTGFLMHAEKFNPCRQRYYTGSENGRTVVAAIVYTLQLDLLTFIRIKSPVKMHIAGIPCSVSSPGIFGRKEAIESLKNHICSAEKGLVLFLNLKDEPVNINRASGKTLPSIVLKNNFSHWDDYLKALRTGYRRRLNVINADSKALKFEQLPCAEFTEEMYKQYLSVYQKSRDKLEKLNMDFFRFLPDGFILTVCYLHRSVIGWNIALFNNGTYYFFLGGVDYKLNEAHHTYLRLLTSIIKSGIENKAEFIELGQTAEIPKMRMGGKPENRYMEAHHSNAVINKLIKMFGSSLEYKRKLENTHAMKEENI